VAATVGEFALLVVGQLVILGKSFLQEWISIILGVELGPLQRSLGLEMLL